MEGKLSLAEVFEPHKYKIIHFFTSPLYRDPRYIRRLVDKL